LLRFNLAFSPWCTLQGKAPSDFWDVALPSNTGHAEN